MRLMTERLILRPWTDADAESLYTYARDPDVGPAAGWPPHKSVAESLDVIRNVLNGRECYAICERGSDAAIGSIELLLKTDRVRRDDECELGFWIGKPFWGRGYVPEAAKALIRRAFEALDMQTVRCVYFDGNTKSKRVQEKLGFVYHHTEAEIPVTMLNEVRTGHVNVLTREKWNA